MNFASTHALIDTSNVRLKWDRCSSRRISCPSFFRCFTLIEMLVVIAIIGILASLMMPSLQGAIASAKQVGCNNNLKQTFLASYTYMSENNDFLPPSYASLSTPRKYWTDLLYDGGYADKNIFACPEMTDYYSWPFSLGYGINHHLQLGLTAPETYKYTQQKYSAKKIFILDLWRNESTGLPDFEEGWWRFSAYSITNTVFGQPAGRHMDSCSVLWLDGHSTNIEIKDISSPCSQKPFNWSDGMNYMAWQTYGGQW